MYRFWFAMLIAVVAAVGLTGHSTTGGPAKALHAIEYRHSLFHVIAWNVAPLAKVAKGEVPYVAAEFADRAARIALLTPMLREGFAEGTYVKGKTEAKQAIWTNRAEFEQLLKRLEAGSATLASVAKSGDLALVKPAFGDLVKVCKDCHEKFKEKDAD